MKVLSRLGMPAVEISQQDEGKEGEEQAKVENQPAAAATEPAATSAPAENEAPAKSEQAKTDASVSNGAPSKGSESDELDFPPAKDLKDAIRDQREVFAEHFAKAKDRAEKMEQIENASGQKLLEMFRKGDPLLLEALEGEKASTILFKLQDAANLENRMFTLTSNLLSLKHETDKTAINNIRA